VDRHDEEAELHAFLQQGLSAAGRTRLFHRADRSKRGGRRPGGRSVADRQNGQFESSAPAIPTARICAQDRRHAHPDLPGGRPLQVRRQARRRAMPGKRVQFDGETWQAIDLLVRDSMKDFQELADEAFRDLLKKHNRPTDLKTALRRSAGVKAEVVPLRPAKPKRRKASRPNRD
jgi:hypothetical protein